jgi:undecaprenyl-diphosphatase
MLETLNLLDTKLFLFLNHINHPVMDKIMLFISYNFIPSFLLISLFIFLSIKSFGRKAFIPFIFLIFVFGLCDSISSKGFKDNTKRLRPMHEPQIMNEVYTAGQGRGGGKYGFVSSHATNSFGICFFIFLLFRKKYPKTKYLFLYASLVAYSRIYLGKHYPLDLFFGALLGILISYLVYRIFLISKLKWITPYQDQQR